MNRRDNISQTEIKLYTTLGCHLCEQALAMFDYLCQHNPDINNRYTIKLVEISESDNLVEEYGIRIPVLAKSNSELAWPFEFEELQVWLK